MTKQPTIIQGLFSGTTIKRTVRVLVLLCLTTNMATKASASFDHYMEQRNKLLCEEKSVFVGGKVNLTMLEMKVNNYLLKLKKEELEESYRSSETFLPAKNFLLAKAEIEKSKVFQFIRKLPKGTSLHTHLLAGVDIDNIISNFTYMENLYGCYNNLDIFKLKVLQDPKSDDSCAWKSVRTYRKEYAERGLDFDEFLRDTMTLGPETVGQSKETVWAKFKNTFSTLYDMVSCRPVFKQYITQLLEELYEDNVFYTELRGTFMALYDLNGTAYDTDMFIKIFIETVDEFKKSHTEFIGAKYIFSVWRGVDNNTLRTALDQLLYFKSVYPDFIAGFDFVGLEDEGNLVDFHEELVGVSRDLNFFFHAGETNEFGRTDLNLVDGVLLNSSRIGHGFALAKHPKLLEAARQRNIAIELCPISNQILKLIDDPRNHPATVLLSKGHPVVICNDDPSAWKATGLSYDRYVVFMSMTWEDHGLEVLKQFAQDSITYSAMNQDEKMKAFEVWTMQWDRFIKEMAKNC